MRRHSTMVPLERVLGDCVLQRPFLSLAPSRELHARKRCCCRRSPEDDDDDFWKVRRTEVVAGMPLVRMWNGPRRKDAPEARRKRRHASTCRPRYRGGRHNHHHSIARGEVRATAGRETSARAHPAHTRERSPGTDDKDTAAGTTTETTTSSFVTERNRRRARGHLILYSSLLTSTIPHVLTPTAP